jgi:hypothetical protein
MLLRLMMLGGKVIKIQTRPNILQTQPKAKFSYHRSIVVGEAVSPTARAPERLTSIAPRYRGKAQGYRGKGEVRFEKAGARDMLMNSVKPYLFDLEVPKTLAL